MDVLLNCFPPGIILDNFAFSKDDELVECEQSPIKISKDEPENEFKKDIRCMELYWRIAVRGVKTVSVRNKKKNATSVFD